MVGVGVQGEEGGLLPFRTESHLEEIETGTGPEVVLDGMSAAREDPNNFSVKLMSTDLVSWEKC